MRLSDLLTGEEREDGAAPDLEIAGLTADSREAGPGVLFAALPGTRVDGLKFVPDAVAAGSPVVLVSEDAVLAPMSGAAVLRTSDPRRSLARMAARLHGPQPDHVVAVTGTNGKTSVASFVAQIWAVLGHNAASIGTLGVTCETGKGPVPPPAGVPPVKLTSPDPVTLHRALQGLAAHGYDHAAIEASSHGLEQRRTDGVRLLGGAFTNITRDHLDYHASFDSYLAAKLRLFTVLLGPGNLAVVNCDGAGHDEAISAARAAGLRLMTHGSKAGEVRLLGVSMTARGLDITVSAQERERRIDLGLVGGFQAENALTAACLATAAPGVALSDALDALRSIRGARGRLEPVGTTAAGGAVYVDYAHTPDALQTALRALRPHVTGRIVTVFGAGGDRDPGKRPLMGEAVAEHSDLGIVTDDNPRSEDAAAIRAAVLDGASGAREIGNRAEAIAAGIAMLFESDALLVAGKGHETGQEIAGVIHPFSDHDVIAAELMRTGGRSVA